MDNREMLFAVDFQYSNTIDWFLLELNRIVIFTIQPNMNIRPFPVAEYEYECE